MLGEDVVDEGAGEEDAGDGVGNAELDTGEDVGVDVGVDVGADVGEGEGLGVKPLFCPA